MQIEQHPAFLKFRRQLIAFLTVRRGFAGPTAGVRHKLALLIVDWDANAPGHQPAVAIPETERLDDRGRQAALGEVRVRRIEFQLERKRWVDRLRVAMNLAACQGNWSRDRR